MRRGERQLRGEQVAVGVDHIEVGCRADAVAGQGDGVGPALRVHLGLLRDLEFGVFLACNERVGHFPEGDLDALLVLEQSLPLLSIGQLDLVETALRAQQGLQQAGAARPGPGGASE